MKCNFDLQYWLIAYIAYDVFRICVVLYKYANRIIQEMISAANFPVFYIIKRISPIAELAFISGCILFVNTKSDCMEKLGIALITYNCFFLFLPLVICLVGCVCFPCIIILVLKFGKRRGVTEDDLKKIPEVKCREVVNGD